MSITFDNNKTGTYSLTTASSNVTTFPVGNITNGVMLVAFFGSAGLGAITCSINGNNWTRLQTQTSSTPTYSYGYFPASVLPLNQTITLSAAANTLTSVGQYFIYTYSSASPVQVDANNDAFLSRTFPTSPSLSVTTVVNNALVWGAGFESSSGTGAIGTPVGYANNQFLSTGTAAAQYIAGDNGITSTGGTSVTQSWTDSTSSGNISQVMISVNPFVSLSFSKSDTQASTDAGSLFKLGRKFLLLDTQATTDVFTQLQHVIFTVLDTLHVVDFKMFLLETKWRPLIKNIAAFAKSNKNLATFTKINRSTTIWTKQNKNL